jgi:hypothetical protein
MPDAAEATANVLIEGLVVTGKVLGWAFSWIPAAVFTVLDKSGKIIEGKLRA